MPAGGGSSYASVTRRWLVWNRIFRPVPVNLWPARGSGRLTAFLMNLGYAPWKGFSLWSPSLSRRRARPDCTAGTLSISVMTLIWMRLRSVCRHWGRSRRARSLSHAALWGIARRGCCNLHASECVQGAAVGEFCLLYSDRSSVRKGFWNPEDDLEGNHHKSRRTDTT